MPHNATISAFLRLLILAGVVGLSTEAEAQRPFAILDPFYQEETARLGFFDGFAAQAHVAYRGAEPTMSDGLLGGPMALSLRVDYALTRQVAVAAVVDASSGFSGSSSSMPVRLSWLIVQPHWHHNGTDYALRLAIDPASDGGFGFRQIDFAFLSTSDLSPRISTDLAVGIRRAQVGFERVQLPSFGLVSTGDVDEIRPEITRSRASGTEIHGMWGYRLWLNPSGTHAFATLSGEGMIYGLVSTPGSQIDENAPGDAWNPGYEGRLRGGVGRLNMGLEYSRPSFLISPYASMPLVRYIHFDGEGQTWGPRIDHARFGLRLTLR